MKLYFTERNNKDHRKEKLIHPFDGRVLPLAPSLLRENAVRLAEKLSMEGVDYILGFAEGGLIPAYMVSEVTGIPFVGSYRVRLKLENEIHFLECHSERANHFIYGLQPGNSVIIIEDEITTGQTFFNVIAQLELNGINVKGIGVYVVNCDDAVLQKFHELGYNVKFIYSRNDIQNGNGNEP